MLRGPEHETVNTVCLGFSYECSEFSQSWFYPWFLAKMKDFGGEDKGFLAKITDFLAKIMDFFYFSSSSPKILHLCQCLHCILMREVPALSMCRHTNEGIPSAEHVQRLHWACADMLMRGNPVTEITETQTDSVYTHPVHGNFHNEEIIVYKVAM